MCGGALQAKCIYLSRSVERGTNIGVYVCEYQSLLPVSLQTRNERIDQMCGTVLVVGFNGQRRQRKKEATCQLRYLSSHDRKLHSE